MPASTPVSKVENKILFEMNPTYPQQLKSSPGMIGRVLLVMASLLALYLASISLTQTYLPGCAEATGCHELLGSQWAHIFGIPASFPAVALYLITVLAAGAFEARDQRTWLGTLGEVCALLITVAAVWFMSLQMFVLKHLCMWCSLTHVFALAGVLFLMISRRLQPRPDDTEEEWAETRLLRNHGLFSAVRGFAVALGVTVLAVGPFVNKVNRNISGTLAPGSGELTQQAAPVLKYDLGRISLNPAGLPRLGSPSATEFAVALTDYTCDFCRLYHPILKSAAESRGDQFAIVLLPAARDDNAALVQQIMLCLFKADEKKYHALSAELLAGTHPALGEAVRLTARALLGEAEWKEAENQYGAWASEQIQIARELRTLNQKSLYSTRLPQLMAGPRVLLGYTDNLSDVGKFLDSALGPHVPGVPDAVTEAGAYPPPVLSLQAPYQDLGLLEGGEVVPCKITFENTGSSDLEVKFVSLDHDCELVSIPDSPLSKGEKGEIEIRITVPMEVTSIQRRVKIFTNAPKPTELMIEGRVQQASSQTSVTK